jgi:hypothetical protein
LLASIAVPAAEPPDDWAYKPFGRPTPPKLAAHPVDSFLLEKLRAAKLAFSPAASKATLLRRVTFDLTGLPPTPAELTAFEKDTAKDAYEKVVDRLLASPRFGERVAVWWLDLARFAETDGFNSDDPRPSAWRYRDYVIDSFNKDKPYDRFLKEQLAGDELFPADPAAAVATGFLRHYPDEYNAVNLEQRRQEILNDITDTTAAAFLGITLGCAKCHDHKTDPILQDDYYRMQAFFAGFWPSERPVQSPEQLAEYAKKKAAWEARTADVRAKLAELEGPYREKSAKKERSRFDEDYANLVDIPFADRTPWQKQIAVMVEKQLDRARNTKFATQLKGDAKAKWDEMSKQMTALAKERPPEPPTAMTMTDVGTAAPPHFKLKRGNWQKKGDEVDPGYLSAIDDRTAEPKPTATTTGRRTELANWIASAKNPLTARVMVNRVWQHAFGRGIVETSSDFGLTGEKPTHPELLDWLATDFVAHGWSVKHVYKLLVTSAAYRQTSQGNAGLSADPENDLLWRSPRKRLDGESLRDAMLAVSGALNPKAGGPGVRPALPAELKGAKGWAVTEDAAERNRRSVYVYVKRNLRYPLFLLFDATDRSETCARRFVTTTAPQALMLVNDAIVLDFAKAFAERVRKEAGEDRERLTDRVFALALARGPSAAERAATAKFLAAHPGTSAEAVTDLCHAVLNLNEFLYVD